MLRGHLERLVILRGSDVLRLCHPERSNSFAISQAVTQSKDP